MAKIKWNTSGHKWFRTGVEKVNLRKYASGTPGEGGICTAWNGVINITTTPTGSEVTTLYADNKIYMEMISIPELSAKIEAYASPEAFDECNGIRTIANVIKVKGQKRKRFSIAWRSKKVDENGTEHDLLHVLYNCFTSPGEVQHQTKSDSPEAVSYAWDISCNPLSAFTLTTTGEHPEQVLITNLYKLDIDLTEYANDPPPGRTVKDLIRVFEMEDPIGWTPQALASAGLLKNYTAEAAIATEDGLYLADEQGRVFVL